MAELADALHSGCSVRTDVQVRLLFRAPYSRHSIGEEYPLFAVYFSGLNKPNLLSSITTVTVDTPDNLPFPPDSDSPIPRQYLLGANFRQIRDLTNQLKEPAYRCKQIYDWMYRHRVDNFQAMTTLTKTLRKRLGETALLRSMTMAEQQISFDGTLKFLFRTNDDLHIESVLIPSEARDDQDEPRRITLCLSTQVGCPLDCRFCATATMKLKRNLTAGEILEQYFFIATATKSEITNIVFMGMGEPMLNYDEVFRAIAIITDPDNRLVGAEHITVSTAGIPEAIRRMARERQRVKLAVSLHACNDELRDRLMPINRRFNLNHLMDAVEFYYQRTHRPVTYEYILFEGLNDSADDARQLIRIARRVQSKVNVIPFHDISFALPPDSGLALRPATQQNFDQFISELRAGGVQVMVRSSSGKDIEAACGQLAIKRNVGA